MRGKGYPQLLNFSRKIYLSGPAASSLGAHPALDPKKFADPCSRLCPAVHCWVKIATQTLSESLLFFGGPCLVWSNFAEIGQLNKNLIKQFSIFLCI